MISLNPDLTLYLLLRAQLLLIKYLPGRFLVYNKEEGRQETSQSDNATSYVRTVESNIIHFNNIKDGKGGGGITNLI